MYLSSFSLVIFPSSVSWKFSCPATTVLLLDVVPLQTNKTRIIQPLLGNNHTVHWAMRFAAFYTVQPRVLKLDGPKHSSVTAQLN